MVAPLKLNGTGGDLKEMTTTEENYLAYQAGLQLAAMLDNDISALDPSVGGTAIGSYTNTFYNEAIGTHPGTSLSIGSTVTTLYQNTGTASETGITRPCTFTVAGVRIDETNDTNFNNIVDRLISTIMTNEYPGVYRLASSSPGADWDVHISNALVDTRANGTVNYNIYQRQTYTAPTAVKPLKLADASGNIKEMSDAEIKLTFGQRAKTRIMSSANYIGAYQLRSSAAGAPVGGTWAARGTATDTRNLTEDVSYVATNSADYSANYQSIRIGTRITNRTVNYVGYYTNPNAINYLNYRLTYRTAIIGYAGYAPGRPGGTTAYYVGYYTGDYLGPGYYTGYYTGDFIGNYVGNYLGDYIGNYVGDYIGNYTGLTLVSTSATVETYTLYCRTA